MSMRVIAAQMGDYTHEEPLHLRAARIRAKRLEQANGSLLKFQQAEAATRERIAAGNFGEAQACEAATP